MRPQAETALEPLLLDPEGPAVAAVGGGHGLAAALEAIQCYAGEISALVSVADNGGSSGRLSDLGIPPPGDMRKCLLALTPEPSMWSELFAHRFSGGDIADHSLGNLILAGLTDLFGDFETALMTAERMLGTVGSVIPVAAEPVQLVATVDGVRVEGQDRLTRSQGVVTEVEIVPRDATATRRALAAVASADQIVIGPGSLYTSSIAALKVNMLAEAIMTETGQRVFVLNLVTQDGETLGMSGVEHLAELSKHAGIGGPGFVIVHDGDLEVPDGHDRVVVDSDEAAEHGWTAVFADVANQRADWPEHDPLKLGMVLEQLANSGD